MPKIVEVQAAKELAEVMFPDIFFRMAINRVLDVAPAANVSVITSAEKQAIFRLGQKDMCDSIAALLRDVAKQSKGTIKADFMAAADLVAEREIP